MASGEDVWELYVRMQSRIFDSARSTNTRYYYPDRALTLVFFLVFLSGPLHRDGPGQPGPPDARRQDQAGLRAAHLHRLVPGLGPRVLDQRPPGARHGRAGPVRLSHLPPNQSAL